MRDDGRDDDTRETFALAPALPLDNLIAELDLTLDSAGRANGS
jgi:hypothetical protein